MLVGTDVGVGAEPVIRRVLSGKDPALERARAEGLQVLEGRYTVSKYLGDGSDPAQLFEVVESAPNLFLTAGINQVLLLACGQSATAFSAANARLCVGDGTTAAAAGQTDLTGTNKFRQTVDSAPVISNNQVTFTATFGQANANFAWAEVGVANAASGGQLWSRTVQNLGTKASSATWVLQWTLAIN